MEIEIINKKIYKITTTEIIINPETGEQENVTIIKELSEEEITDLKNKILQRRNSIIELQNQNNKEQEILDLIQE